MVTHFIFMSSSYSLGKRIALDYILKDVVVQEQLKNNLDKIIEKCGDDVSISTHMIQAENEKWEAVCKSDSFFKEVEVIKSLDKFIELIQKDRTLKGIDIAKYILSKVKCTQLKLQKLVYFCFADYLCSTDKELFTDKIYAFQFGPVIESVYEKYKKYGYNDIKEETGDINSDNISEMPAKSRILFAENGVEKMASIEKTLEKYGDLSASDLVKLTHEMNTPWSKTQKGLFSQIKMQTIKKYHKFEEM